MSVHLFMIIFFEMRIIMKYIIYLFQRDETKKIKRRPFNKLCKTKLRNALISEKANEKR